MLLLSLNICIKHLSKHEHICILYNSYTFSEVILIIMVKWVQILDSIAQSFPHLLNFLILTLINLSISPTFHNLLSLFLFLSLSCWAEADRSECVVVRQCPLLSSRVLAQLSSPAHFETEVNSRCNCFDYTALQGSSTDKSLDIEAIFDVTI